MPDNPRQADHSDIPLSRPSAGVPHSSGSSSGGNYNPPPPQSGPSNKFKNIIIGSIATIVTSTVVFLITQSLKKSERGDDFLTTKQATTSAWNSYVGYENIYANNMLSLNQGTSIDSMLSAIKMESQKFQRDVNDLSNEKKIDKDLKKVLIRRLENEKASFPVLENYFAKMQEINGATMTMKERVTRTADEMEKYNLHVKGMYERAINDVQGLADVLSKRYDQKFSMNEFVMVQIRPQLEKTNDSVLKVLRNIQFDSNGQIINEAMPVITSKDIIGNWNADGAVFTFEKNGKMAWVIGGGQTATGTWSIVDNKLRLDGKINTQPQKGFWLFIVTDITGNSITLTSVKDQNIYYDLVRIMTQ